jgi:hypothetical protein
MAQGSVWHLWAPTDLDGYFETFGRHSLLHLAGDIRLDSALQSRMTDLNPLLERPWNSSLVWYAGTL